MKPVPYDIAVSLINVSKEYRIFHEKPTLAERFIEAKHERFRALDAISLQIRKGERVSIIGPNGAGKTTLLKVISGITIPTSGTVSTHGRVVSLISQDAGFHPELTGEQNIYLNALLLGMKRPEILDKTPKIIAFAGINQFIDLPFYTYSEGMKFRLGFAIATYADADILIMDESMNVIDRAFERRAVAVLKRLIRKNKTFIISTHTVNHIMQFTTRTLLMNHGKIIKEVPKRELYRYV